MKRLVLFGTLAAAVLCLAACVRVTPKVDNTMAAEAASGSISMFATLAVGEFDAKTAPLYTKLAVVAHTTAINVLNNRITVTRAKEVQATVNDLRTQLVAAEAACAPDKAGKCTKDARKADALLASAATSIALL